MTAEELFLKLSNPPAGSKLAQASEYGLDLTLYWRSLTLTPDERLRELQSAQPFLDELIKAGPRRRLISSTNLSEDT